jgi:hypothetical protein
LQSIRFGISFEQKYRLEYALAYNFKKLNEVTMGVNEDISTPNSKAVCQKIFCGGCKTELGLKAVRKAKRDSYAGF